MDSVEEVETRSGRRASTRPAIVGVLVVGGLLTLLHGLGVLDPEGTFTVPLVALTAAVCTVIALRKWQPTPKWPWYALGGMLVLFLMANAVRFSLGTLGDLSPSRSLIPDMLAVPAYV